MEGWKDGKMEKAVQAVCLVFPSLKLTASLHLKIDGWNTFLLGRLGLFPVAFAVSFRECNFSFLFGCLFLKVLH